MKAYQASGLSEVNALKQEKIKMNKQIQSLQKKVKEKQKEREES